MNKSDFNRWYEEYQKTENINNPAALYACLTMADKWDDKLETIYENAWNECKQFQYATKQQFNDVFVARFIEKGSTQLLAEEFTKIIQ